MLQLPSGAVDEVYRHLAEDATSRDLFTARVNYSNTGDLRHIFDLPAHDFNLTAGVQRGREMLAERASAPWVVFGAGDDGHGFVRAFKWMKFSCFIDNYKNGRQDETTGLPVVSLAEFQKNYDLAGHCFAICNSARAAAHSMCRQLLESGVPRANILYFGGDWRNVHAQYFDLFQPVPGEAFVDCGCFDGGTAFRFAGWCGAKAYRKIWSFEPDPVQFEICSQVLAALRDCEVLPYGLSNKRERLAFMQAGEGSRVVSGDKAAGTQTIEAVALDDVLDHEKVTFIKMDIEGAEHAALLGAKHIIESQKPRLAISIYHDVEHIISIPKLLLALNPAYRFFLRHYSILDNETILYAE